MSASMRQVSRPVATAEARQGETVWPAGARVSGYQYMSPWHLGPLQHPNLSITHLLGQSPHSSVSVASGIPPQAP